LGQKSNPKKIKKKTGKGGVPPLAVGGGGTHLKNG